MTIRAFAFSPIRYIMMLFAAFVVAFTTSGCGMSSDDYVGTWMGLDQHGGNSHVYQYEIETSEDGEGYIIRVTQFNYNVDMTQTNAVWKESAPHFFRARLDKGNLVSDIGVIKADPANFRLLYGNIPLVRKAKNTELKLKYVVRGEVEAKYPGIEVLD